MQGEAGDGTGAPVMARSVHVATSKAAGPMCKPVRRGGGVFLSAGRAV